jgi:hypothetical protein
MDGDRPPIALADIAAIQALLSGRYAIVKIKQGSKILF